MNPLAAYTNLPVEDFADRHLGPTESDVATMLGALGYDTLDSLMKTTIPDAIHISEALGIEAVPTEEAALARLREVAERNQVVTTMIGAGYYGNVTPNVILRNILENPAWYTAYTPYQPEISQGRLEALLNFQTVVTDLTGMEISNASMLDEATAAAEAMMLARRQSKVASETFFVDAVELSRSISKLR